MVQLMKAMHTNKKNYRIWNALYAELDSYSFGCVCQDETGILDEIEKDTYFNEPTQVGKV